MLVNDENVDSVIAGTEQEIRDMAGLSPTLAAVCASLLELVKYLKAKQEAGSAPPCSKL